MKGDYSVLIIYRSICIFKYLGSFKQTWGVLSNAIQSSPETITGAIFKCQNRSIIQSHLELSMETKAETDEQL